MKIVFVTLPFQLFNFTDTSFFEYTEENIKRTFGTCEEEINKTKNTLL